jgi:OOP family OmpA-OmpF porin
MAVDLVALRSHAISGCSVFLLGWLMGCRMPGTRALSASTDVHAPAVTATPAPAPAVMEDRDADGIADAQDRCPDEPEDLDQFEDRDGCVDRDNDGDGILDAHELRPDGRWTNCDHQLAHGADRDCRNFPEDVDGYEDHDGCPDILTLDQCLVRLPERVPLDRRGELASDAPAILDAVAASMQRAPSVKFWVEAHLDDRRDLAAAKRSTQRAASQVIEGLVRRGVARERIEPRGWGAARARATNKTAEGQAANRRVEFTLTKCTPYPPPAHWEDTPENHECR